MSPKTTRDVFCTSVVEMLRKRVERSEKERDYDDFHDSMSAQWLGKESPTGRTAMQHMDELIRKYPPEKGN